METVVNGILLAIGLFIGYWILLFVVNIVFSVPDFIGNLFGSNKTKSETPLDKYELDPDP